jgi:hypothetical protein
MFGQGIRRLEVFETASDEGVLVQYVKDKKAWGWYSYARSSVGSGISSVSGARLSVPLLIGEYCRLFPKARALR